MTNPPALAAWHRVVQHRDIAALGRLRADDVCFIRRWCTRRSTGCT